MTYLTSRTSVLCIYDSQTRPVSKCSPNGEMESMHSVPTQHKFALECRSSRWCHLLSLMAQNIQVYDGNDDYTQRCRTIYGVGVLRTPPPEEALRRGFEIYVLISSSRWSRGSHSLRLHQKIGVPRTSVSSLLTLAPQHKGGHRVEHQCLQWLDLKIPRGLAFNFGST